MPLAEPPPGPPKRVIEAPHPIASHCDCSAFSSGEPALDTWLKRNALKSQASGAARTYVITAEQTVVRYFGFQRSPGDERTLIITLAGLEQALR